jgi:SAM-dependent methyltransferase
MDEKIGALIECHRGLERQGPGDAAFSRQLLSLLPALPPDPCIVDLGCGTGAGALLLAEHYRAPVTAVALCRAFLDELDERASARGLRELVRTVEADIGSLGWPRGRVHLLWSEGSAYNLTFAGALAAWRPLLAPGGVAVISELSWFSDRAPAEALAYWRDAYPAIAGEAENAARAKAAGFELLGLRRLPSQAWWDHYYGPLQARINGLKPEAGEVMRTVIKEVEAEMALFRAHSDYYGYSFYLLRAV